MLRVTLKIQKRTSLGPVVKTLSFHYNKQGPFPGQGTKIPTAKTNEKQKPEGSLISLIGR